MATIPHTPLWDKVFGIQYWFLIVPTSWPAVGDVDVLEDQHGQLHFLHFLEEESCLTRFTKVVDGVVEKPHDFFNYLLFTSGPMRQIYVSVVGNLVKTFCNIEQKGFSYTTTFSKSFATFLLEWVKNLNKCFRKENNFNLSPIYFIIPYKNVLK